MIKSRLNIIVLLMTAFPVFSANVNVPSLELYTRGSVDNGAFGLESRGEMDLLLEGGYKFGGRVVLGFSSLPLETDSLETASISDIGILSFKSASATLRNIFDLPLNFTYFIGESDIFCSGDVFPDLFGTFPMASSYRGYLHFPDSTFVYDGIHLINGTGLQIDITTRPETLLLSFYLYHDSMIKSDGILDNLEPGHYSYDVRTGLNFEKIKLEAFLGATYPAPGSDIGYYRGGLLFYAKEEGVEFMAQIGIPRWRPLDDTLDINLLYMLFEPRVKSGILSIIPTFFWRPAYYHQQSTGEQVLDVNLNFQFGDIYKNLVSSGLESNITYQLEESGVSKSEFRFKLSPYVQFATSGLVWEVRINTKLWPFDIEDLIEGFLALKAEF